MLSNGIDGEPKSWRHFAEKEITGFRAPYLSTGKALYAALAEDKFSYDASGISRGPAEPASDAGLTHFALPQIAEGPKARRVIAMDYNLFVRHSGGLERPSEAKNFEDRAYDAFLASFNQEYHGKRVPLPGRFPLHADERRRILARVGAFRQGSLRQARQWPASATLTT